jgi:AcrR family transcriptional regulator
MSQRRIRDLASSRKEILEVTFRLIFERGFQGVSIDDIVSETSMTKGALYHQFPTKLDLGYALVEEVITPMVISRWIDPIAQSEKPLDEILQNLKRLIGEAPPKFLRLGCPLNNLVQEMAPLDKGFHIRLQNALQLWIDGMAGELARAKRMGQIRRDVNTRQAAHFIVMAHEGFYGMMKGLNDPKAFDALYGSMKLYLNSIAA